MKSLSIIVSTVYDISKGPDNNVKNIKRPLKTVKRHTYKLCSTAEGEAVSLSNLICTIRITRILFLQRIFEILMGIPCYHMLP